VTLKTELTKVRKQLQECSRPIFLFDDDPDGLSAFLLLYRMVQAGKGIPLKGLQLDEAQAKRINEYSPDLVVVLDKPEVSQEFFSAIRTKCIWIDHHEPQNPKGITYINPRIEDAKRNISTSQLCYEITNESPWIAVIGIVADWQLPPKELWELCEEKYPGYLPLDTKDAPTALFTTKIGELARVFSFNLKGKTSEVLTALKILTRIKGPSELLEKKHSQAKLVMKKYEQRLAEYKQILGSIEVKKEDPLLLYTYSHEKNSYTVDISNELMYKHPEKIIIIARQSNGSYKCSLRASTIRVDKLLEEVFQTIDGTGGGHEHACGAVIPVEAFESFVETVREKLSEKELDKRA